MSALLSYAADARTFHLDKRYSSVIYGRETARHGGGRWLQYWFFYYYNVKNVLQLGVHEGDWEMIQIGLSAKGTSGPNWKPDVAVYAQHGGPQWASWPDVEKTDDGHPVVYVARSSHASLVRPGLHAAPVVPDFCDGEGVTPQRPCVVPITDSHPAWVSWPGRWGASKKQGRGLVPESEWPRFQRPWIEPDEFAADGDRFVPQHEVVGHEAAPRVPPVADVIAEGPSRIVRYDPAPRSLKPGAGALDARRPERGRAGRVRPRRNRPRPARPLDTEG